MKKSILSDEEESQVICLKGQIELKKPVGYFVAPDGTKRPTFPAGGEWNPPFPLSSRHRTLGARIVFLARKCADQMEHQHRRAILFWGFNSYEIYSGMLDRVAKSGGPLSDSKVMSICEDEFSKICRRRARFIKNRAWEIPFSQMSGRDAQSMYRMVYG